MSTQPYVIKGIITKETIKKAVSISRATGLEVILEDKGIRLNIQEDLASNKKDAIAKYTALLQSMQSKKTNKKVRD